MERLIRTGSDLDSHEQYIINLFHILLPDLKIILDVVILLFHGFIMNISEASSKYIDISGIAWSKGGEVEGVEIRIDGGKWVAALDMENDTWAKWTYRIETKKLSKGNHTIEARAVSQEKYSLIPEKTVAVTQSQSDDALDLTCLPIIGVICLVAGVAFYIIRSKGRKNEF